MFLLRVNGSRLSENANGVMRSMAFGLLVGKGMELAYSGNNHCVNCCYCYYYFAHSTISLCAKASP